MVAPTTQKGNIGLSVFRAAALKKRYITSIADEGAIYDIIVDKQDGKLYRVQVKYRNINEKGIVEVKFSTTLGKGQTTIYNTNNIDALVIYEPTTEKILWIPSGYNNGKNFYVRFIPPKINNTKYITMCDLFEEW